MNEESNAPIVEGHEKPERRIEVCDLPISELKVFMENPRTISPKKKQELQESLDMLGDFGIIVIDENNDIISGHQRVEALKVLRGEDEIVHCKRLIGYSEPEKKAISIKANTHSGDWDLSKLADFTANLEINLGLDIPTALDPHNDTKIKDMELIHYEKYDYVLIACRNELDYQNLIRTLGIEGKKVVVCKTKSGERKIKARAVWYDQMKCKIQDGDDVASI